ncbi:hypothetical protein D3C84_1258200 [compost metagenome]
MFTQADLARLNHAIATGELSVEKDGRKITYRSIGDLIKARDLVLAALTREQAAPQRARVTVGYIARG